MSIAAYVLLEPNTNSYYFGSTSNIDRRLREHFTTLRNGTHQNIRLQKLWDRYGELEPLVYYFDTIEEAQACESAWITSNVDSPNMMNIGLGVFGGDNLTRHPLLNEIVDRRTRTQIQRCEEMGERERMKRWARFGPTNPMFGRTHTPEVRRKLAELHSTPEVLSRLESYKSTENYRLAISRAGKLKVGEKNSFFGKHHTEELKEKFRQQNKGQIPPNATRVCVFGVEYYSIREACEKVGISYPTMIKRLKSVDPNYSFVL